MACIFFQYNANLANLIFIICSATFLVRDNYRFNRVRILGIVWDNWLLSLLFLIGALIIGVRPGIGEAVIQLIPTIWGTNWFITTYVLYYLSVPLLNKAISKLSQRVHLQYCMVLFLLYCGIQFVLKDKLYYSWYIGFMVVHIFVSYKQKYIDIKKCKWKRSVFVMAVIGYISLILATNASGSKISIFAERVQYWNQFLNPFELIVGFGIVEWLSSVKIKNEQINRMIIQTSMLSLEIYLIHNNYMVKSYLRPWLWEKIYQITQFDYLVITVLGFMICTFVISFFFAKIYHRLFWRLSQSILKKIDSLFEKTTDLLMNISS